MIRAIFAHYNGAWRGTNDSDNACDHMKTPAQEVTTKRR